MQGKVLLISVKDKGIVLLKADFLYEIENKHIFSLRVQNQMGILDYHTFISYSSI